MYLAIIKPTAINNDSYKNIVLIEEKDVRGYQTKYQIITFILYNTRTILVNIVIILSNLTLNSF